MADEELEQTDSRRPRLGHYAIGFLVGFVAALPAVGSYWRFFPLSLIFALWGFPMVWRECLGFSHESVHVLAATVYAVYGIVAWIGVRTRSWVVFGIYALLLAVNVLLVYL